MPKSTYNMGGQRRTINAPCGWMCKGSIREVNGRLRIHQRSCGACADVDTNLPAFNSTIGANNGWGGVVGSRRTNNIETLVTSSTLMDAVTIKTDANDIPTATTMLQEYMVNNCCVCNQKYTGYGHNPYPLKATGRCCDACNTSVIFARIKMMKEMNSTL